MLNPQILEHCREQKREEREELFTQRYEGLLAWALRLTDHHRASAEDLVQDAFIQFVLARTSIDEIDNIDGYLHRMLRNMHLTRITRNSGMERMLSIIDYDSFHQGLRVLEPSRRLQVREELLKICGYACARKETSRAGVVLILRYFHEYYPSEIASVLNCSPHCVAQWQRVARNELKVYLNGQGRLRLFRAKTPKLMIPKLSALNGDLIAELRQMIFRSRQGACLPAEQLREIYKSGKEESLSPTRLAHIVSCRECLDVVNRLLDLPLLAERCDSTPKDSDKPPHDNNGNGSSGEGPFDFGIKCQKRLREVVEHKPQELHIAVNGTPVSSLKINSDFNELSLNIPAEETIKFVEVLSEQNFQLLFFSVGDEANSGTDQWAIVELSEGRTLEASLQLGKTLRIVYREPDLTDAPEPLTLIQQEISSSVSVADNNGDFGAIYHQGEDASRSTLGRIWKLLRSRFGRNVGLTELTLLGRVSPMVSTPLWANPTLITALILVAIGTISAYFLRTNVAPTPTAALLLEQANQAEELIARVPNVVVHQMINLEERNSSRALVARRKIETWEDSRGNFAQRLYDENNRLLAGTWQKADSSRTVYHHRSDSRLYGAAIKTDSLLLNLEDVWQVKLSAKEFKALVGTDQGHVTEQSASYIVTYDDGRQIGASRLVKATLTLNRTNLHAIEQTLLIERGNEVREYRFSEITFERLTQKDAPARVFEPDAVLERPVSGRGKNTDVSTVGSTVHHASTPLSVASAELEVDVAYLLNQAKADRHEQVSLSRTAKGLLQVEGVVDTQQRKVDFLRALSPVSNNPLVKIEIVTVAEALQRQPSRLSPGASIREVEQTVNTIAVDRELRDYLSRTTETWEIGTDLDKAVRSFSSRTVNRAYRALFHAIELKRLMNRFAKVDMRTVTPDARAKWLQMVREHAAGLEREIVTLRRELQPVFSSSLGSISTTGESEISNDVDLAQAVERIHKLALANNDAIRSGFTISSQSSSVAIKSPQFWRGLTTAGALAARIRQYNG